MARGEVGEQLGPVARVFTTPMVLQFCRTWGSAMPSRFTDDEVARKEGLPHAIVPGIMSFALLSNLLTASLPGGQLRHMETLFRRPVPHNQPLRLTGAVTAKRVSDGREQVECDVHLLREDGETLVTGSALVTLPSRAG